MGPYRAIVRRSVENLIRLRGTWTRSGNAPWLFFVFFYAVAANIPYWIASSEFGFLREGWFCLEFAAIGIVALFVPSFVASALLLAVIAADLLLGICRTYYLSIEDCLAGAGLMQRIPHSRLLIAASVVLLALLIGAAAAILPASAIPRLDRMRAEACLIAFAVMCVSSDCAMYIRNTGGFNTLQGLMKGTDKVKPGFYSDLRLCRFLAAHLVKIERAERALKESEGTGSSSPQPVPSATERAVISAGVFAGNNEQDRPNLVIVLVESWGAATDSVIRDALIQPYLQPELEARYEVMRGTVPFYGGTVAGEARELCGTTIGYHLLNASPQELGSCLPHRLAAVGYRTMAVHGSDGRVFNRQAWYNTIGFQEMWFHDRFRQQGLPDCLGMFIGTCDAAIANWIGNRLDSDDGAPNFVHWTTLNSHLPVLTPSPISDGPPCDLSPLLASQESLCSWFQLVGNVHRSVSRVAMSRLTRPTVFVIVGDHAPPFGDQLRSQFLKSEVPYVLLLPRKNQAGVR